MKLKVLIVKDFFNYKEPKNVTTFNTNPHQHNPHPVILFNKPGQIMYIR